MELAAFKRKNTQNRAMKSQHPSMDNELLLGVDVGTYESKGVLSTPDGSVVASATVAHELSLPHAGWAEHDAEGVWWHDFVAICRRLLITPGVSQLRLPV